MAVRNPNRRNRLKLRLDVESEGFVVKLAEVLGTTPAEVLRALVRKERAAWEGMGPAGQDSRLTLDDSSSGAGGKGAGVLRPAEGRTAPVLSVVRG